MNPRSSFVRKLIYLAAMVPLVGVLYWLGQPAFYGGPGQESAPGGILAQDRHKYGLSHADLGQIDPAGETIRLASLGMRGVAALVLWEKANEYYKKKDFVNFSATVKQTTKLQPHFIAVWRFQGWVFAYNCSVQFDDYRERYRWVIKGIDFLRDGLQHNKHEPILQWDVAWFISQKIGRADEWRQYRRLFKQDDDFHGSLPVAERDNWLVGKKEFSEVEKKVDAGDKIRKTPLLFRSDGPKCQMNYAETIEKEGVFGEVARRAWSTAAADWRQYGGIDLPLITPVRIGNEEVDKIHLNDEEMYEGRAKELGGQIDALAPGLRQQIIDEQRATLSDEQREALDAPEAERTVKQMDMAAAAEPRVKVSNDDVVRRVIGPNRKQAIELKQKAAENEAMADAVRRNREIVNFVYWRRRAEMEQTDDAVAARQWIYQADELRLLDLNAAFAAYNKGLAYWRKVLDNFPDLIKDELTGTELMDVIRRYQRFLEKEGKSLPENFPLNDILKRYEKR